MPLLIGLGELLWDLLPDGPRLGGAPANFAASAGSLGASAAVISRVGNDANGNKARDLLAKLGLNIEHIQVDEMLPTGIVSVSFVDFGQPQYTIQQNVAWDSIESPPDALRLAQSADAICFGSLAQRSEKSCQSIHQILQSSSQQTLRIFDVNLRQHYFSREILEKSLQVANILKVSDEELPVFAETLSLTGPTTSIIEQLAEAYQLNLIALTRGAHGSLLWRNGQVSDHPGVATEVADTIGAGDSFTAAMTLGQLAGWDLDLINQCANRVAAFVCSQAGAMPTFPAELKQLFE
jgi:fructokinase